LNAIVSAIERGDGEAAAKLSAAHVQKAGENVLRSIEHKG